MRGVVGICFKSCLRRSRGSPISTGVSIANVAVRYVLDRPTVAGVIIGVRLSVTDHRTENARLFDLTLDTEDQDRIELVLDKSRDLSRLIGDCGDEYRR